MMSHYERSFEHLYNVNLSSLLLVGHTSIKNVLSETKNLTEIVRLSGFLNLHVNIIKYLSLDTKQTCQKGSHCDSWLIFYDINVKRTLISIHTTL